MNAFRAARYAALAGAACRPSRARAVRCAVLIGAACRPSWARAVRCAVLIGAAVMALAAGAQTPDDLVRLIETGDLAEARARVAEMERARRSPEQVLFLKGLLTADGDSAVRVFERFLMLHPASKLGDEACYRIAQLQMSRGLYRSALRPLHRLLVKYPDSPNLDKGFHALGMCHLSLNAKDSAAHYFRRAAAASPGSEAARSAAARLTALGIQVARDSVASPAKPAGPYTGDGATAPPDAPGAVPPRFAVQVYAFANQTNALMRKSFFEKAGYPVMLRTKRRDNALLHLVWIGPYATWEEARQQGEKIKDRYTLPYHLVAVE